MRILVNAFAARRGGGKWFTGALIQKLAQQNADWHFMVFYADENFAKEWPKSANIELHCIPEAKGYVQRTLWQQFKLRGIVKKERVDLIFSPLNIGMLKPPVPQVAVQRNAHHLVLKVKKEEGGKWLRRRMQLLASLASIKSSEQNVFVSQYMVDLAGNWLKPKNWHVIYNAVNKERFNKDPERIIDDKYLLFVGGLAPHKNVDTLIKAFDLVTKGCTESLKLVIVGTGGDIKHSKSRTWSEYLFELVKDKDLTEKVVFWGPAKGQKLVSLYKYAEVCVSPSLLESFGIVPAEALCCGTACVVSDIDVFHEIYGDSVLYCDAKEPADMAGKIRSLLDNKKLHDDLMEKSSKLLSNYDISIVAEKYTKVLKQALGKVES
ncbi:MAG: glycosyltransferase family 4 protein [Planctomycetota bacterium]|jgi:glycosyltransferase involved in cell wall biosynthesis